MPSIVESAEARFERLLSGEPADTEATYSLLREEHPLLWSSAFNGWVVSRHADVRRVLESSEFAPLTEGAGTPMIYGRTVLAMSGEEHRKKTGLLARRIRNPRRLEEEVRPVVRRWSQEMANELPEGPTVFDIKAEFFTPLPLMVIARLMGTEGSEDFRGWYRDIVAGGMSNMRGDTAVRDRAVNAREQLFEYLRPRLEEMADGGARRLAVGSGHDGVRG